MLLDNPYWIFRYQIQKQSLQTVLLMHTRELRQKKDREQILKIRVLKQLAPWSE